MNNNICIFCDYGFEIGYGHLIRSHALANELEKKENTKISFLLEENIHNFNLPISKNYTYFYLKFNEKKLSNFEKKLLTTILTLKSNFLFIDSKKNFSEEFFSNLKKNKVYIGSIDDTSKKRLFCDLCFYPPVNQALQLKWPKYKGKIFIGWEWIALRKEFTVPSQEEISYENISLSNIKILLMTGGSDPKNIALMVLNFLDDNIFSEIDLSIVVGPANKNFEKIKEKIQFLPFKIKIIKGSFELATVMKENHISITTFGSTCYELASLSKPTLQISLNNDHLKSSELFVRNNMAISLGKYNELKKEVFKNKLVSLIKNKEAISKMISSCKKYKIFAGSKNIASEVYKLINS